MKLIPLAAALLLAGLPVLAHHSFGAEYDADKPLTLKGVIIKIDWENPHMHFYLDVTNEKGEVEHWKFEGFPPNMLVRQGWTKNTLKEGDQVSVFAWQARDSSKMAHSREITWTDGKKLLSGPPAGTGGGN
jgi:hypothetical protein